MTDDNSLTTQMKTGLRNLIEEIRTSVIDLKTSVGNIGTKKDEEDLIPEHWKNPDALPPIKEPISPVAVEPTIIYELPTKPRLRLYQPTWFIKIKRIVVFIILIGSCLSSIGLVLTFPFGLILTIPTAFINFDYLLKTQPKSPTMRWDLLPNIEKEDE